MKYLDPNLASELLELERLQKAGGLSDETEARWMELTDQLFGRGANPNTKHKRSSYRIPSDVEAVVKVNQEIIECRIGEVSLANVTLFGATLQKLEPNQVIQISSITVGGANVDVSINGRIVRQRKHDNKPALGVVFEDFSSPNEFNSFFAKIYYPLYISYLEASAKS